MIVFCQEVYNRALADSSSVTDYTSPELNAMLASAEKYLYEVRVSQVGGTAPTLTVAMERSNDGVNWDTKTTPVSSSNLSSAQSVIWAEDTGSTLGGCFARLKITLAAQSSPTAQIQIVLTGRDD